MCGIAGVVEYAAASPQINEKILKSMSDEIVRRGPDSEGAYVSKSGRCGLAFRRLAIVDLSEAGNQPMTTRDGRYSIVFNGEIYNHAEIRKELERKGYKYRSRTDTETILYGYVEWGERILDKMIGMWAFAIWDDKKRELFCARDRIGIKPFYFYAKDGRFVFASEIKAILRHPKVSSSINYEELPNYLNWGTTSDSNSLFKNIRKLSAAKRLRLTSDGEIEIKRYWEPIRRNGDLYSKASPQELGEEILRLLKISIKDRMMSDVPFGVFLSGGVDSSLNVALMSELMSRPVDTFSVGFKDLEKYNELEYARKVAKLFKTNHREITIDDKDAFDILEDLAFVEDEPNADPVCMPLYYLSKLTRESGTIVVQVGEGSDELFLGYGWALRDYLFYKKYWKPFSRLPVPVKKTVYELAKPIFRSAAQYAPQEYLRRAVEGDEFYWSGAPIIPTTQMELLLAEKYFALSRATREKARSYHKEILSLNPGVDYLQRMAYIELRQRLAELLLMRVDKIGMAHSIEARVPFLDHRLVELAFSIPPEIKAPDKKSTKIVLKKAVESVLPKEIIYRKKQGFWAPVNEWLKDKWHNYALDKTLNSVFVKEGVFDAKYVEFLFDAHKKGKAKQGLQLFSLLTLSLWAEQYFKN